MDIISIILLVLLALGVVSNNATVAIAVAILLLIRLLHLEKLFPIIEQHGLQVGITILTIGVLAPIASGKISPNTIWQTFTNWESLLAIAIGIFVSYLGGRGAHLMTQSPLVVTGLLVGTILGVSLFKGVPVGPLIAAGMMALLLQFFPK